VAIDLTTEQTESLSQAARTLPPGRAGRPVSISCMLRWILEGVRLPSGDRARLEAIRLGGRWLTSKEALQRFAEAQTPNLDAHAKSPRTPTARSKASECVERELEKAGI